MSSEPERTSLTSSVIRPRMRGVADIFAAAASLPAGVMLVEHARPGGPTLAAAVYAGSLSILLCGSALYHRKGWSLRTGLLLRKIDHANIYFLIAGSATPVAAAIEDGSGRVLLIAMWVAAAAGIAKTLLWSRAHRAISAAIYVGIGVIPVPFVGAIGEAVGREDLRWLGLGGALYVLGAIVYARRWPNPDPFVFGYHEIFHLFVFAAAAIHFVVIWGLVG
ncbi:MAG: hemolysin III family protein [Myxococcales bacterium]|nr:hemolysin III family protein [Myxococcales bacterium]